jgi:hypothetical protein
MARSSSQLPSSPAAVSAWRGPARRDQAFFCVLGIGLLACSAGMHRFLDVKRGEKEWNLVREDPASEKKLESLAITLPRLTLGGMRGIASTYLWIQAEDDKNDRRWFDLETKYDIIGALQPYFASVYIYHSWNQAYNLSAQWQEPDTKYKWVLDGLSYVYKGEDFNPAHPDIYLEIAQLYTMKLGSASERIFYRQHWRSDLTRLHEIDKLRHDKIVAPADDATVSLQHVYNIVHRTDARDHQPYFHIQLLPNPNAPTSPYRGWGISISDPRPPEKFNLFKDRTDGKPATDPVPFRYGVSPFYFGYCEYTRLLALPVGPTYTGGRSVNSWPAMCLRLWCRDDMYYTYDTMRQLFGKDSPKTIADVPAFNAKVDEIHDCHRNVQMIGPRSVELFTEHLSKYPEDRFIHPKHQREVEAYIAISKAEIRLFDALVAWQLNGQKIDDSAEGQKIKAALLAANQLYKDAVPSTEKWVDTVYPVVEGEPANPDRAEFQRFVDALKNHSRGIEAMVSLTPGQEPDMSFLDEEVVDR